MPWSVSTNRTLGCVRKLYCSSKSACIIEAPRQRGRAQKQNRKLRPRCKGPYTTVRETEYEVSTTIHPSTHPPFENPGVLIGRANGTVVRRRTATYCRTHESKIWAGIGGSCNRGFCNRKPGFCDIGFLRYRGF